jgi:iron complex outermembrane recepter protein
MMRLSPKHYDGYNLQGFATRLDYTRGLCCLLLMIALLAPFAVAEDNDILHMSLEDLLNIKVTVASKSELTLRETPGIVTIVTDEDIKKWGARDLVDVLRRVPGIDFAMDVQSVIGMGMRGFWGHEGKILLLWDGIQMNETLFATTQFGNRYPVNSIKRIEIIRGPGSAIYGGTAELGVINVITKSGADLQGMQAGGMYRMMEHHPLPDFKQVYGLPGHDQAYGSLDLSIGQKKDDYEYSVHGHVAKGPRSDLIYTDIYGDSYEMNVRSTLMPKHANFGFRYKNLRLRALLEKYHTEEPNYYDYAYTGNIPMDFSTYGFSAEYDLEFDKLKLTPRYEYTRYYSWNNTETGDYFIDYGWYSHWRTEKSTIKLTGLYQPTDRFDIVAGGELNKDHGSDGGSPDSLLVDFDTDPETHTKTVNYSNIAFFLQGMTRTKIGNITLGARYEDHDEFGDKFVPRVALTKIIGDFHTKLLVSKAFRTPCIMNVRNNPEIKTEETSVTEIEMGYRFNEKSLVMVNLFDIKIEDPIIYSNWGYENFDEVRNRGFELVYKQDGDWGNVNLNYSYYKNRKNEVIYYEVPDEEDLLIAFPAHKVNLYGTINLSKHFSLNPSLTYFSKRYGYDSVDENWYLQIGEYKADVLADLFLNMCDVFTPGLTFGLGVYDIFDIEYHYIQAYASSNTPLPGTTREIGLRMSYDFDF